MPLRRFAFAMFTLLAVLPLARPTAADGRGTDRIVFQGMAQAFANGVANEKVTVVVFGAEWCGACEKLERSVLTDPAVRKAGAEMTWAKIDLDKDPQLAAMFGVRAVPTILFLNTKGEPLKTIGGLPSVQRLSGLLSEFADKATEPGTSRGKYEQLIELVEEANKTAEGDDIESNTVLQILDLIAAPDPVGLEETRHRLVAMGPPAWRGLVDAMDHRKLAVRAAAYHVLKETTGKTFAYDPFLKAEKRAEQLKAWRDWLDATRPQKTKPKDNAEAPEGETPPETTPRAPR